MRKDTLYVGLDTDKKHIDVAVAEGLPGSEVRYWGRTANRPTSVDRLVKKLGQGGRELVVCYEAGPCGYGRYRHLSGKRGVKCLIVAPSIQPVNDRALRASPDSTKAVAVAEGTNRK